MANPNNQTEDALVDLYEWIVGNPNCTRGNILYGMKIRESVSESTVLRRLDLGVNRGLLIRSGSTSNTTYVASDKLRMQVVRNRLSVDHSKRARVGYNEDFLEEYVPNVSSYLNPNDLARLHSRCPPGSAPLSKLDSHEVSMFMCDISYASSRLEGNEYDYASTIRLAEHNIEMHGGTHSNKVMILNHHEAARYIIDSAREADEFFGINQHVLRGIHSLLSHDLLADPLMCGALRTKPIQIWQSAYIPMDIPEVIAKNFNKIIEKANQINDPYEKSFFLLVHLPYLQPFEDCNKRSSRVMCNIPLLQAGITPVSWIDITNKHREYTDAVISIYEFNDTLMLSEIFVDSFMRSTERFALMSRQKAPDPIASIYRPEIKATIRAQILDGVESISPRVSVDHLPDYMDYIANEIELIKKNEMLAVRYGINTSAIRSWMESLSSSAEAGAESEPEYDRMR